MSIGSEDVPKRQRMNHREQIAERLQPSSQEPIEKLHSFHWGDIDHQKKFLELLAKSLNFQSNEDWNHLTRNHIIQQGGGRLWQIYPSIYQMLITVFPKKQWTAFSIPKHFPKSYFEDAFHQREYLKQLANIKNVSPIDLSRSDIYTHSGNKIFQNIAGYQTLREYLESLFPLEKSSQDSNCYTYEKQREFLDSMKEKFHIRKPSDWLRVTSSDFRNAGGSGILFYYSSYRELFSAVYPDVSWQEIWNKPKPKSEKKHIPTSERKKLLKDIAAKLNLTTREDWVELPMETWYEHGGRKLSKLYASFFEMVQDLLPEIQWIPFQFTVRKLPKNFWDKKENQFAFLQHLEHHLSLYDNWDQVSVISQISQLGGGPLIRKYGTLDKLLEAVKPETPWNSIMWRYIKDKNNFLESKENQRDYLEYLGQKYFHIEKLEDWCFVSGTKFRKNGGYILIKRYNSFVDMLKTLYPEHPWDFVSKQRRLPRSYWDDIQNVREFVKKMEQEYHISCKQDWYRLSTGQLRALGGARLLSKYKLYELLKKVYPEVDWDESEFSKRDKRAVQRWLYLSVQKLFPKEEIIEEYRIDESKRESGIMTEVDVYVSKYQLAFEYQGEHHFKENPAFGNLEMYRSLDEEKFRICDTRDIHLVTIPFWWDRTLDNLKEHVDAFHPSLLFQTS